MNYYLLPMYLLFGILPSLIWLLYYLRKDLHPEPKNMIVKIFLLGCVATLPTLVLQLTLLFFLNKLQDLSFFIQYPIMIELIKWFIIIAFTEELLKFAVVKLGVFNSYVVDEPLDIMLYMVVAALGFAAVENVLYLSPINGLGGSVGTTALLSGLRFLGATFLHTLCSALLGYFLALSSLKNKKGVLLTVVGLSLATGFHGLYDFAISTFSWPLDFAIPFTIMVILIIFMIYDFDGIKKIKSICKI